MLPKHYYSVEEVVREFAAVSQLRDQALDDPVLFDEYEVIFEDLQEIIKNYMPDSIPEKYEMGTINISGLAGLHAALKWIKEKTISRLYDEETKRRDSLLSLLEEYDFISGLLRPAGHSRVFDRRSIYRCNRLSRPESHGRGDVRQAPDE